MLSYHTCPLATLGGKDTGGMNVYVRDLTRQLGAQGIKVDVFTRSQDEHVPHVLHHLGYGNRVVHIPAGPEVPLPKSELSAHLPEFVQGIKDFSRTKGIRYDLIHSHYWLSGLAALELKEDWEIPVTAMFHTLGLMKNRVAQPHEELEGDYRIQGERKVMDSADRLIAATPAELAQLQWLYHIDTNKVIVIPPGVDVSRFYPIPPDEAKDYIGIPPEDRMVLYVGRIEPLKGLDVLFEAMGRFCQHTHTDQAHLHLTIIGGDPEAGPEKMSVEMSRLKELREKYGLEEMVTFRGKQDQDTLPYYYSAAEVVVVPSHYESFGMVALEAMSCGTPVVASQVGGLAYLVKDGVTGYTVPVGDPHELCNHLRDLMEDRDLRKKMGEQAASFAQEYAWENIAARISTHYKEMVAR
jgi:D-inositol-3-phosphate glycosyltransferase